MTTDTYFDELAAALRTAGVPEDEVAATVADLAGHLAETGTAPEEEFGPAAAFAARLGGAPEPEEPEKQAESWTWTADIFNDRRMLAVHGDQGWEVEGLDHLGRFVCRRVPGEALRWEYRRETLTGARRARILAELGPEGWESCGEWMGYGYFKRPKAAGEGPEAALHTLPEAPRRRLFLSRRGMLMIGLLVALTVGTVGSWVSGAEIPTYWVSFLLAGTAASGAYTAKLEREKAALKR
ncbi:MULTISPECIES: hypothetical protein [Streptomyces]|uniref:DUF1707 domain-containing protein n=1 Tax=Streptomyces solicathayae TaxID=3081768 RepID=A0ABZ0LQZ3_9ACTN|nr:hypothetical protein [Streptomyces sp. HUAS YS2]WOX21904.1 hypothetical protein R2D22_11080 [Streptomyces sp. HUAS YS2]